MSQAVQQGSGNRQAVSSELSRVNGIQGLASPNRILLAKPPVLLNPPQFFLVAGVGVLTLGLLVGLPVALMLMGPPPKKISSIPVVVAANTSENNLSTIPQVERDIPRPSVVAKDAAVAPAKKRDTLQLLPIENTPNLDLNGTPELPPVEFAALQTKKIVDDGLPKIDESAQWGPGNPEKKQFTIQELTLAGITIPDVYLKQLIPPTNTQSKPQNNLTVSSPGAGQPGYVVNNPSTNGPTYVINTPIIHLPQYVVVTPVINFPSFVVQPPMMNRPSMVTMSSRGGNPAWMLPKLGGGQLTSMIPNFAGGGKMPGMIPNFGGGKMTAMIPNFGGGKKPGMVPNLGRGAGGGGGGLIWFTNFQGGGKMNLPRSSNGGGNAMGGCMK